MNEKQQEIVYVGLGGNLGNPQDTLLKAVEILKEVPEVQHLTVSRFYWTKPVSAIPQNWYLNAVCRFETSLPVKTVFNCLQNIEKELGKVPKEKEAPRVIDLDLLFFGYQNIQEPEMIIPHARWRERLFVAVPLLDLTETIKVPQNFSDALESISVAALVKNLREINDEVLFPAVIT